MRKRFIRRLRRRAGFTMVELLIVMTLMTVIGTAIIGVLLRQQRFHRAVSSLTDARARMRDIATILPTDLRSISSVGNDILAIDVNAIQFRSFLGSSVLCRYHDATIIDLPPRILGSGYVLTSWINPPAAGDVVFLYDDGGAWGNLDDSWAEFAVEGVESGTAVDGSPNFCGPVAANPFVESADNGRSRFRLTLSGAPNQAQVKIGAPVRIAREVRYSVYLASDGQYYVGYQRCATNVASPGSPGDCDNHEVLAGPVLPATTDTTTSGLFFVYYDQNGGRIEDVAQASQIARISVGVRTTSESLRQATATKVGTSFAGGDSVRFSVGIRNRI